jgi:F-type H+-transporting ATPase subunit b
VNLNATLLGQMITFAIFVWFSMRFVWPHISNAIAARQKTIADGLAAADKGQRALADAHVQVSNELRQARERAAGIVEQAEKQAGHLLDEAKEQAKQEAKRLLLAAQADIAREAEISKRALQAKVVALAVAGAEKILQANVDEAANAKLLASLATEI